MKLALLISLTLSAPLAFASMDDNQMDHDNMEHGKMEHSNMEHNDMKHSDMSSMPMTGMSQVGMPAKGAKPNKVVHVILNDDKPMQFKKPVEINPNDVVQFVVMNAGSKSHEFAIGSVAELQGHHKMMAKMAGMEHDTNNSIIVGSKQARQFTWHFHGDNIIELACNIKDHQQHGKSVILSQ